MIRKLIHKHLIQPEIERMIETGDLVDKRMDKFFEALWRNEPTPIPSAALGGLEEYRMYREAQLAAARKTAS